MAETTQQDLLTRLAGNGDSNDDGTAWAALAATEPQHATTRHREGKDEQLAQILKRISTLAGDSGVMKAAQAEAPPEPKPKTLAETFVEEFVPVEPDSFRQAQLTESQVESLVIKLLLARGAEAGRLTGAVDPFRGPMADLTGGTTT